MKKVILSVAIVSALLAGTAAKAQLIDEQNVTVTMDLQPILQLNMNGATNVDFIFDQISEYVGGITQYGATQLSVSSSVSWDLYAVGFSSAAAGGDLLWDNQVSYGAGDDPNAVTTLPLTLLELHQDKANPDGTVGAGASVDYATAFSAGTTNIGFNNVYANSLPYTRPVANSKYIAGGVDPLDFVAGGSYLIESGTNVGFNSSYSYTIDYRIIPGLPAVFPRATSDVNGGNNTTLSGAGTGGAGALNATTTSLYARPGVYTMNVKYVLVEN
jgi:hypothetical protein